MTQPAGGLQLLSASDPRAKTARRDERTSGVRVVIAWVMGCGEYSVSLTAGKRRGAAKHRQMAKLSLASYIALTLIAICEQFSSVLQFAVLCPSSLFES